MDIILLTGFLGTGKTTTLRRLLTITFAGRAPGVIVNDLSDLEVDGELIRLTDTVSERHGSLASLTAGAISAGQRTAFAAALRAMADRGRELVLVEASGGAHPAPICAEIAALPGTRLAAVITFVDARALHHDHSDGLALEASEASPTATLLTAQVRAASLLLLTKLDLVPAAIAPRLVTALQALNPNALITSAQHGRFDTDLLDTLPPPPTIPAEPPPDSDDFAAAILRDPRPFHPGRLHRLFVGGLPLGLHRTKGFLWLASRPADVLLLNQAGGALGLELLGTWRAALLDHGNLLPDERTALARQLRGSHPRFGDRINELTLIGAEPDRSQFLAHLTGCLCTEEEIQQWEAGAAWEDPWPRRLRVLA